MTKAYAFEVACVINGHNLGDAVIQNRSIKRLLSGNFARTLIVWTRPGSVAAYDEHAELKIVASPFPVGTDQRFGATELRSFLKAAMEIRRIRPDVALDFFGDFREVLFAKLIGAKQHLHVNWAADHPYRKTLRYGKVQSNPGNPVIKAQDISVYRGHEVFVDALLGAGDRDPHHSVTDDWPPRPLQRVGLHPFASQVCKLWPGENWVELARRLLERGLNVVVFGAPADEPQIRRLFAPLLDKLTITTGRLSEFLKEVHAVDALIGLDSLGVHAAERAGVRAIMLAGSNHVSLWTPPHAASIGSSGGCKHYPCFNRPVCQGQREEYICIKSVTVDSVETLLFNYDHFLET